MSNLSFQLYSARNFNPIGEVFALLSRVGLGHVEGYGGLYEDPKAMRGLLDAHGLAMSSGHFGLDQLRERKATVEAARTIGITDIFCPAIPNDQWKQDENAFNALADELADLGRFYKQEGFGFGWHNHHFEFWPAESGRLPMDIILERAPEIDWEMDVAWVVRGGNDPLEWIERYGNRITAAHVKDLAPEGENADEDGWADVGHGTMDWKAIMAALDQHSRVKHLVLEHDNPADLERFARRSVDGVRAAMEG
ncbi:sugar phosphate isomerase/epimerase family protein [Pelagibacterium montanilacus]|uniref:sugar phosphate isomerase/epimerase family protein n=1 Tax=Pelagibacterium montanilacus TaxID=2185280 RepID=UPI000F8EB91D|nr:sugar phosphate isomerase/epimerase [Pelagibacterium montanilacus]